MPPLALLESVLDTLAASPWTYALVFGFAVLDVLLPVVPSEAAVIVGGVVAATGELHIAGVVAAGAAGAMLGDHLSYGLGRAFGARLIDRFARGEKARRMVAWAESQVEHRGGGLLVTARFIPGGRTAATLASGSLQMRWRKFFAFDLVAALIWAGFAGLLGYFGGQTFQDDPTLAIVIALTVTISITVAIEVIRAKRGRGRAVVAEGAAELETAHRAVDHPVDAAA